MSLQAAATMNAGLQNEVSRGKTTVNPRVHPILFSRAVVGSSNQFEPTESRALTTSKIGSSSATSSSAARSRQSPNSGRRRSTVLMNLQANDPNIPAPGEMVSENQNNANSTNGAGPSSPRPSNGSPMILPRDPHHSRTPSLGELHQELEEEQEAQVVSSQGGVYCRP